jgi:molybdate transport system substrate-binding protein
MTKKLLTPALLVFWLIFLIGGAASARAAELLIFGAASLTDVLQELAATYEKPTGDKIVFSFGASNTLARQIQAGAPADLFLSADEQTMDGLDKRGLLLTGTRKSVLSNTLVVVVPAGSNLKITSADDLAMPAVKILALAEPQSVPAGVYAKKYLQTKKLWNRVIDRVVPTESVRAALAAVEVGNADAGIVYKTDAGISKKVKIAYEVPRAEGPKISYPFAVVGSTKNAEAARRFLTWLESAAALEVFRKYGFLIAG